MNWTEINSLDQLHQIISESEQHPVLIYKHSTRCGTSRMVLDRLERNWNGMTEIKPYFLDLISHREISNAIADTFGIEHESPQVLLIANGRAVYDDSHYAVNVQSIVDAANALP